MLFKILNLLGRKSHDAANSQDKSSPCYYSPTYNSRKARNHYDPEDREQTVEDKLDAISRAANKRRRS